MTETNSHTSIPIPRWVWESNDLSAIEKLFMTEIINLDRIGVCFAQNAHFSELFNLSTTRCSQIISVLNNKGVIRTEVNRKGLYKSQRIITVVNSSKKQEINVTESDYNLANFFYDQLLTINDKHKKPNLNTWAKTIYFINTSDKRTHSEIKELIIYAINHNYWQSKIIDPYKLKKNIDELTIELNRKVNKHGNNYESEQQQGSDSFWSRNFTK